jgi:alkanesulfonate monooxygenase SsuD/methylene tetrahydromethanopterin reductase-like flavin-dependent oxidoreductase (luciferase family)
MGVGKYLEVGIPFVLGPGGTAQKEHHPVYGGGGKSQHQYHAENGEGLAPAPRSGAGIRQALPQNDLGFRRATRRGIGLYL